jgi:hypothetical protein
MDKRISRIETVLVSKRDVPESSQLDTINCAGEVDKMVAKLNNDDVFRQSVVSHKQISLLQVTQVAQAWS